MECLARKGTRFVSSELHAVRARVPEDNALDSNAIDHANGGSQNTSIRFRGDVDAVGSVAVGRSGD